MGVQDKTVIIDGLDECNGDPVQMLGAVHTGMEVHRIDLELSGLVERPWLQLMCCAICLPHGRNFR